MALRALANGAEPEVRIAIQAPSPATCPWSGRRSLSWWWTSRRPKHWGCDPSDDLAPSGPA